VALSHVRAEWTAVLDADDEWLPGGLDRLLATAEARGAAWCAGLTVDLHDDGRRVAFPRHLEPGAQERGTVYDAFPRLGFLPFHGCAVLWRTSVLWDVGGWPAVPTSEDTALVLAASERHAGHYVDGESVYGYRRHAEQTVVGARVRPSARDRERVSTRQDRGHPRRTSRLHGLMSPAASTRSAATAFDTHRVDDIAALFHAEALFRGRGTEPASGRATIRDHCSAVAPGTTAATRLVRTCRSDERTRTALADVDFSPPAGDPVPVRLSLVAGRETSGRTVRRYRAAPRVAVVRSSP